MYNNYYQPYQPIQQTQDERIWVQGIASAEAYLVAPNSFVRLWDSNKPIFYEKRTDATGRPLPIEAYSYAKIESNTALNNEGNGIDYSKEIRGLNERLTALERSIRNDKQSYTDVTAIQPIQSDFYRQSSGGSNETP